MAGGTSVWGIDIGQTALKALKLRPGMEGKVELVAFDVIEHPKILSQPDADADELIRAAFDKFLSRNDWQGDQFVIGVAGQQTFARFCKLPPVDAKKIPDIVKFEAGQQIPFDMDEVVWDYQVFSTPDTPDVEVGIFAIKKELIKKQIDYFAGVKIAPVAVQTHPCALYNFCRFDRPESVENGATVLVDIGAQNTDLIIVEQGSAWSRNIPLGGNNFTEALVKAFKLSFAKAENLKRTAASSKYARQIFQAMRPVFADLVAEIQRSIGFYSSTHRDVELNRVLGLGSAFRMPGLQKYLENNLTIPGGVEKLEKFAMLVPSANLNAPQFTDNVLSFGVAYGLALQGLGLAAISASLLPQELARVALWKKKSPLFGAAAASLGLAATFVWARLMMDHSALAGNQDDRAKTSQLLEEQRRLKSEFSKASEDLSQQETKIKGILSLYDGKRVVPGILALVNEALPEPALPELESVASAAEFKRLVSSDKARFARTKRKRLFIEKLQVHWVRDIEAHQFTDTTAQTESSYGGGGGGEGAMGEGGMMMGRGFGRMGRMAPPPETATPSGDGGGAGGDGKGGFVLRLEGRLLHGEDKASAFTLLESEFMPRLRQLAGRKGLGLHIPDEDPKTPSDQKKYSTLNVNEYYQRTRTARELFGGNQPTGPAAAEEKPPEFADPVTGEDMSSDWKFVINVKLKMGDKPEPKSDETRKGG